MGNRRYRLGFLNEISFSFEQVFADGVGDPAQLVKHALENVRRAQEGQAFLGTTRYKAIVLTEPRIIRTADSSDDTDKDHFKFRARIPEVHSSLADPFCYMAEEGTGFFGNSLGIRAKRAIARHPIFRSDSTSEDSAADLVRGDIVIVDFEKGPSNTRSNGGRFIKLARMPRFEGYETTCDELVNDPPNDWCNLCTFADPIDCTPIGGAAYPPGSGGTTAAFEGRPVNLGAAAGTVPATTALGNTNADASSGPCSSLYYEDNLGLGIGAAQVTKCCCGQVGKFGDSEPSANHDCGEDVMGCHSLAYNNHEPVKALRANAPPGVTVANRGVINCATGQMLDFVRSPESLHEVVRPLWLQFVREVEFVTGGVTPSYTSVRRSVKKQWILYTGRQGLAHAAAGGGFDRSDRDHSGIYIPMRPLGAGASSRGASTISSHIAGYACDVRWRYPTDANGLSTDLSTAYVGLTYHEMCEKINSEIAGAGTGRTKSSAFEPAKTNSSKFGIGWFGTRDDPHWEMFWAFLDTDNSPSTPGLYGTPVKLRDLDVTQKLKLVSGAYFYGLHGDQCCNWNEDFVDLPLDYLADRCPDADLRCLAALGDPTTYKPSIVGAYALQNEGTVGPSGYPALTQIEAGAPVEVVQPDAEEAAAASIEFLNSLDAI